MTKLIWLLCMYLFLKMSYVPPLLDKTFHLQVLAVCHPVYKCASQDSSLTRSSAGEATVLFSTSCYQQRVECRGRQEWMWRLLSPPLHPLSTHTHTQTDMEGVLLHFLTTLQPPAPILNPFLGTMQQYLSVSFCSFNSCRKEIRAKTFECCVFKNTKQIQKSTYIFF